MEFLKPLNLEKLNTHFSLYSYANGYLLTDIDIVMFNELSKVSTSLTSYKNIKRWYNHLAAYVKSAPRYPQLVKV